MGQAGGERWVRGPPASTPTHSTPLTVCSSGRWAQPGPRQPCSGTLERAGGDPGEAGVLAQKGGIRLPALLQPWLGVRVGVCMRVTNQPISHSVLLPVKSEGKKISPCMDTRSLHKLSEVNVAQSCPTFCDPWDYRVHGILQAKRLEWEAFPVSRGSSQPRNGTQVSRIAGTFFTI